MIQVFFSLGNVFLNSVPSPILLSKLIVPRCVPQVVLPQQAQALPLIFGRHKRIVLPWDIIFHTWNRFSSPSHASLNSIPHGFMSMKFESSFVGVYYLAIRFDMHIIAKGMFSRSSSSRLQSKDASQGEGMESIELTSLTFIFKSGAPGFILVAVF